MERCGETRQNLYTDPVKAEKHRPGHGHDCDHDRPATQRDIRELGHAMAEAFTLLLQAVHGEQAATKTALDKVFRASEKQSRKLEKLSKPPI